jgi:ABC-2 type transport system ATP-binding protein
MTITSTIESPTTTSKAAVRLTGLRKHFGDVRAVNGVDLTIAVGETVALLGPNGAGKSTTIGMMLGLLDPDAGEARLFGDVPHAAVEHGQVGAMLQDGGLPDNITVGELIGFARSLYPQPLPMAEIIEMAGLAGLERRRSDQLSGGQAQRVRFALALAGNPGLLVLDEPTAALDVESRRAFWASMHAFASQGHTILFATHYLEEADANADRVIVIAQGRVVADGSGADLKAHVAGRSVSFELVDGSLNGLDRLPGVTAVEQRGSRVTLQSGDTDATLAALMSSGRVVRDIDIRGASLEDAFLALTAEAEED